MFTTFTNMFTKPNVPIRVPNDDTSFNPKEYPNVSFVAKGNLTGNIKIIHDSEVNTGSISTRLWVHNEKDAEKIAITPSFDNHSCSVVLESPHGFSQPQVYHETMVRIPAATRKLENVYLEAPNSSLFGDALENLWFGTFRARMTNGSIDFKPLHADEIDVRTANSAISGQFEASKIHLQTSNGQISAIIRALTSYDQKGVTPVHLQTTNGSIDTHLDASQAVHGLNLTGYSSNGKITAGVLLAQGASNPSLLDIASSNGRLDLNVDAAKLGNALEIKTKSSNASIVQAIMVPPQQPFRLSSVSSNAKIEINLTDDYEGGFDLSTSNGTVNVEGTNIRYSQDKKNNKQGHRGNANYGCVSGKTSNSTANLRFYPTSQPASSY